MQTAHIFHIALASKRINQMHAAASGEHKDVFDAATGEKLRKVVGNFNHGFPSSWRFATPASE
jgi:hypothetical protein